MALVFLFLFGLCIGSFLNVLILRTNTGENLGGRSRCFSCLRKLEWHDLIPVISYITIRGKCRYCKSRVSLQYPIVEATAGIIFVSVAYVMFGADMPLAPVQIMQYALVCSFFAVLLAISVYDLRHKIIPDQFSVALFAVAVLVEILVVYSNLRATGGSIWGDILAALGAFAFFGGIWFLSRGRWMGFGDAKIAISIGLFLGYPGIVVALLLSFWIGALVAAILLVFRKYSLKMEIPFAPFLALGTLAAFFVISSNLFMIFYKYVAII